MEPPNGGERQGFQSTRPVWGGTHAQLRTAISGNISIHPPRVGRDILSGDLDPKWLISIHPPRVGRDVVAQAEGVEPPHFNPPAPCGAGPTLIPNFDNLPDISIHPPRVGRDPGGIINDGTVFISIHPPRVGRDCRDGICWWHHSISIHPPRVGRDL